MTKYAREPEDSLKVAKARGSNLRVHFKNSRETAKAIKGMNVAKAKKYLEDVMEHKRCIVFRRFCGGVGRTALAKNEGSTNGQVRSWRGRAARPVQCSTLLAFALALPHPSAPPGSCTLRGGHDCNLLATGYHRLPRWASPSIVGGVLPAGCPALHSTAVVHRPHAGEGSDGAAAARLWLVPNAAGRSAADTLRACRAASRRSRASSSSTSSPTPSPTPRCAASRWTPSSSRTSRCASTLRAPRHCAAALCALAWHRWASHGVAKSTGGARSEGGPRRCR